MTREDLIAAIEKWLTYAEKHDDKQAKIKAGDTIMHLVVDYLSQEPNEKR